MGNEAYKLGSIYDGTFDMELSGKFAALNIYTREECGSCWARFYCSGGCSASNLLVNGDIKRPTTWDARWSASGWSARSHCAPLRPVWQINADNRTDTAISGGIRSVYRYILCFTAFKRRLYLFCALKFT